MTPEFITTLKNLIADRGIGVLDNAKLCRSFLLDYGNTHKREINLFTKALEKKFGERLQKSSNRDLDKKQLAQIWYDDEGVEPKLAGEVLSCLCHVLFNEPLEDTPIVIPAPAKIIQPSGNTFTDPRDGKTYRTVKIGTQIWMAENLNYDAPSSWCYDKKYGRLYDWETAKKVAPPGWHLPTNEEWQTLVDFAGGEKVAGKKLKAKSGWNKNGNGTDDYGFVALPGGGYGGGYFYDAGSHGYWWSASEKDAGNAYIRYMNYGYEDANWYFNSKSFGFSVRCLQD